MIPRPSSLSRSPGFTLIELMVVIIIIGVMTAMMIPEMKGSFQAALLRSTSRDLINVFELAYSQAVSLHQVHRVALDESSGRYVMEKRVEANGLADFVPANEPGGEGYLDPRIKVEFRPPGEVTSNDESATEPAASGGNPGGTAIDFYPDGTADPGAIVLRDHDGYQLMLQINPITARIHVVELARDTSP